MPAPVLKHGALSWRATASARSHFFSLSFKGALSSPLRSKRWRPGGRLERRTYYNLADHVEPSDITFDAAVRGTRELICDAARVHMRSDVPIAFSLSGGFDSSALLAALDEVDELHKGVACYSVDFGSAFSEQPWIDAAAAHHAVRSHVAEFTATDFRDSIRPMMWHLEAPIGGLMNCAQLAIASAARENGFKVIQDGSGLDEACGGYRNHHNLYLGLLLSQDHQDAQQAVRDYARNWGVDETAAIASARAELNRVSTSIDGTVSTRLDLLAEDFVAQFPGVENRRLFSQDRLKNELIDYLQVRKIPRNTRMRDRTTMAYGIELRLPYLDHRLIEYALGLPGSYYFRHGRTKSIAREAFAGAMDDDVRIAAILSKAKVSRIAGCSTAAEFARRFKTSARAGTTTAFLFGSGSTSRSGFAYLLMVMRSRSGDTSAPTLRRRPRQ